MRTEFEKMISRLVVAGFVAVAVLYGGAKPAGTNAPPLLGVGIRSRSTMESSNILCTPTPSTYTSISNWTARGAYCDWERIDFRGAKVIASCGFFEVWHFTARPQFDIITKNPVVEDCLVERLK